MDTQQIREILEKNEISIEEFAYGDFDCEELGEWTEVESYGGEDQGSQWYSVKYFKDHDIYVRTDGYYQSHYGTDFDDYGRIVSLKQKTVQVYE